MLCTIRWNKYLPELESFPVDRVEGESKAKKDVAQTEKKNICL